MFYGNVFKALNKARVKYVVVGGTAVVLHGYTRFTQDLDLIVYLEKDNLSKLFVAFKKIGYDPKVPVTEAQFSDSNERARWKKEKGMIVFSFFYRKPPFSLIDIFVDEPIAFHQLYKQRKRVKVEGTIIPLVSIDHLKRLKRMAGRHQDLIDIVQLDEIKKLRKK